jgi:xylan 1,4-beta-xylosidase
MQKWAGLICALVSHAIDRYGLEEILKWYFEVWNEPNLYKGFWDGTQAEYFQLYMLTARTIKAVHPALKVGGPASSDAGSGEAPWIKDFLTFCEREHAPVDFISTHPYPNAWPMDTGGQMFMTYRDSDSTRHDIAWVRDAMAATPYKDLELHLTEWNSSPSPRDLIHDTAFMAPFLIQNNLRCLGLTDSLGYWTFTDVFEEGGAGDTLFHGGFGLINFLGLKKAGYYGYWYLARLGSEKLTAGDDFIITRQGETIQVLLWNYCHYTESFAEGDRTGFNILERYGAFDEKTHQFNLKLDGLQGSYKVVDYLLDREHGSAYDAWLSNGALESPAAADLEIIRQQTGPAGSIAKTSCQGTYQRQVSLAPHGVLLIELYKNFTG